MPAVIAPLLGSLVFILASRLDQTSNGYRLVFALAAIFLLLGARCVRFARENRNTPPPALSTPSMLAPRRHTVAAGWRLAFNTRWSGAWIPAILAILGAHHSACASHPTALERLREPLSCTLHALSLVVASHCQMRHTSQNGDRDAELHINIRARAETMTRATSWRLPLRLMADDLLALAAWKQAAEFPPDVCASDGFTLLSRAAPRLQHILASPYDPHPA